MYHQARVPIDDKFDINAGEVGERLYSTLMGHKVMGRMIYAALRHFMQHFAKLEHLLRLGVSHCGLQFQ